MYNLMCVTSAGESLTSFATRMCYFNVAAVSLFQFILACYNVASIVTLICMKVERKIKGKLSTCLNLLLRTSLTFSAMQVWPAIFLSPVHTYPDIFENGDFFLRLHLSSTRKRRFTVTEKRIRNPSKLSYFTANSSQLS